MKDNRYDVIIVGSGPAGLTGAIYTTRAELKTLVVSGSIPGGQLMVASEVENFPGFLDGISGPELIHKMQLQAEKFGTVFVDKNVIAVNFKIYPFRIYTEGDEEFIGRAILIATGAEARKLNLADEERFTGRGISYCATCDGYFFRGKNIAVVGGGNTALEESLFLTKFASNVTIIHRREQFRASKILQERILKNAKISILWNKIIIQLKGDTKLNSVKLKDTVTGEESEISLDGLFVAIGYEPATKIFSNSIDLDEKGYVCLTTNTMTSIPGVFAAGNVCDPRYRQAVTAAGMGCMAAIDIEHYLQDKGIVR